jgi:hypothetical protein
MLTEKQKTALTLINRAGAAKTLEARAKNISKVIQALNLGGRELVEKAAALRKQASDKAEPFEILSALCQEKLGMYYGAGRIYLKHNMMDEVRRLVEACSTSVFNVEKFHAAKLCMLLGDFGRVAAIAREVEKAHIDFVLLERARENEAACVRDNLILAGKIYAELESIAPELGMWRGEAARIAHTLMSDGVLIDAMVLFHSLGMNREAMESANGISYNPETVYDTEHIKVLIGLGMDHKALEIAEGICVKPSRVNRTTKAAEIFLMLDLGERAAAIFLSNERPLDAIAAMGMED